MMSYNQTILQIEYIILIISGLYILYYIVTGIYSTFLGNISIFNIKRKTKSNLGNNSKRSKNLRYVDNSTQNKNELSQEEIEELDLIVYELGHHISSGEFDIAKNLIIRGLAIDKFNVSLNKNLADIYIYEKSYSKAELIYKDLLIIHSEDISILNKLGYTLSMQEKYDLAIEVYKKIHSINPKSLDSINMLANLYYHTKKYVDAISFSKLYLREYSDDLDSYMILASSYESIDKLQDAIKTYEKILSIKPDASDIEKTIAKLKKQIDKKDISKEN